MANTKISQLTALSNPTWSEELVYAFNNANGKMTLNTMKTFITPDLTWYQEKLVSWTNIKTINWYDILWSWNITISWWGGWAWETWYDCVVDASGNWDYTTITAALAANNRMILVMPWTYNETEWNNISNSWVVIHGIDPEKTIVNVTINSSDATYPYFIKLAWTEAKTLYADISWLTINLTNSHGNWCLIHAYSSTDWHNIRLSIHDCIINVTWSVASYNILAYMFTNQSVSSTPNNAVFYNNLFNVYDSWYITRFTRGNVWEFNNCTFYLSATWAVVWLLVRWLNNCHIWGKATDSGYLYTDISDADNIWMELYDNSSLNKWWTELQNVKNSYIEHSYWTHPSTDISWSTVIQDWASSTSYSVWDYVWDDEKLLECIEAHTSQTMWAQDDDKWNVVSTMTLFWNMSWTIINLSSGDNKRLLSMYSDKRHIVSNNQINYNKIFIWWRMSLVDNHIDASFVQNRWWMSLISWNKIVSNSWAATLYYADNYSLIQNNIVAWKSSTWAITILWTSTNTSSVWTNLLMKTDDLS